MEIIPAKPEHLPVIMQIIDAARDIMRANGNHTQWINGYPASETILEDIRSGHGYICTNAGETVGYFCFIKGDNPEPNYNVIENGKWLNDAPYGVIHRLASTGKVKGVAKACFDYCFSLTDNIKVDTNHNNVPMQNFFKKYGFSYCGIIYVNDGSSRDAFQMKIS